MSGFDRFPRVLRLFSDREPVWTVQAISDALNVPQSTVYRTVRDLMKAGFLETATGATYRLGAAFSEFDRIIRLTDPLVQAARPMLHDVVMQAHTPCVGLVSRVYNGTVMCVADEISGDVEFRSSYERGRPMPLTRGATSKIILANLPTRQLNRLLTADLDREPAGPFRRNADEFRGHLADIRKRGYCVTRGEIDPGKVGLAAPVIVPELGIFGSLSLVTEAKSLEDAVERRLVLLVVSSASLLTETLRHTSADAPAAGGRTRVTR